MVFVLSQSLVLVSLSLDVGVCCEYHVKRLWKSGLLFSTSWRGSEYLLQYVQFSIGSIIVSISTVHYSIVNRLLYFVLVLYSTILVIL